MHIPLKIALLIDFSGAAIFFGAALFALAAGSFLGFSGFGVGMLAFVFSAYIQHCRSVGLDVVAEVWILLAMALASAALLILAARFWVLA